MSSGRKAKQDNTSSTTTPDSSILRTIQQSDYRLCWSSSENEGRSPISFDNHVCINTLSWGHSSSQHQGNEHLSSHWQSFSRCLDFLSPCIQIKGLISHLAYLSKSWINWKFQMLCQVHIILKVKELLKDSTKCSRLWSRPIVWNMKRTGMKVSIYSCLQLEKQFRNRLVSVHLNLFLDTVFVVLWNFLKRPGRHRQKRMDS